MGIYKICPHCGASLDVGEACDCIAARYESLTPANRDRLDTLAMELIAAQRANSASAGRRMG